MAGEEQTPLEHKRKPKKVTYSTQVDPETGEVIGHSVTHEIKPKIHAFNFFMIEQTMLSQLASEKLEGRCYSVLLALLAVLDYENYIRINQSKFGEKLGMKRQQVNKHIQTLLKVGVLLEGDKEGVSGTYKLNTKYGYKGSLSNWEKTVAAERKLLSKNKEKVIKDSSSEPEITQ